MCGGYDQGRAGCVVASTCELDDWDCSDEADAIRRRVKLDDEGLAYLHLYCDADDMFSTSFYGDGDPACIPR